MIRKIAFLTTLVLIFTIPWETAITVSSLGTLTRLIGFGAAGIWGVSVIISGRLRRFHAFHVAFVLFVLFNLASVFWTVNYEFTSTRIKTFAQLAVLSWILWDLITTPEELRQVMQVFIIGAYVTIGSQLYNFFLGQTIETYSAGRFSGAGQNAVEFALILSLSLPLAWYLAISQKPGRGANILKAINFAYIPLALLATVLTASRTSLVTNVPGLLYILGTLRKIRMQYRILIFIVFIIAVIAVQPLIPQATLERLSTIGQSISGNDLGGRTKLWVEGLNIFLAHPFIGIGSNGLSAPTVLGTFAHNTFISILAELGLVGLLLFLAILVIVFFEAIKQPEPFSALWLTVLLVWFVGVFTLTWEYTKPTWFFLSIIVISGGIYHRRTVPAENQPAPVLAASEPDIQTG
jgi:O-antigen ligase